MQSSCSMRYMCVLFMCSRNSSESCSLDLKLSVKGLAQLQTLMKESVITCELHRIFKHHAQSRHGDVTHTMSLKKLFTLMEGCEKDHKALWVRQPRT